MIDNLTIAMAWSVSLNPQALVQNFNIKLIELISSHP